MNNFILTIYFIAGFITKSLQNYCEHFPKIEQQCICPPYYEVCDRNSISFIQWSNYHIVKTYDGEVDVILQNVKLCENKEYVIKLQTNKHITNSNECNENNANFKSLETHSGIELVKCSNCRNISDNITIKFNYMFTGCYVATIVEDNRAIIFGSAPKFISTDFPKELNSTSFELLFNSIPTRNETKIEIRFNSINMTKRSISTSVVKKKCKKNCVILKSVTEISLDQLLGHEENFRRCIQIEKISWSCSYSKNSQNYLTYSCFYYELKPGDYYFTVALIDEYTRCNRDSLWVSENVCGGYHQFNVPSYRIQQESYPINQHESLTFTYYVISFGVLILILLKIFLVYYIYKKSWKIKSRILLPNKILLVYARDTPEFSQMIEQFKNILSSIDDTVVYDIIDEDEIFIDRDYTENIISDVILNPHAKIILFLNKCSLILKGATYTAEYFNPNCKDVLFNYAFQQLSLIRRTRQDLDNLYIVGIEELDLYKFENFNTKKRYLMPDKIMKLLKAVFPKKTKFERSLLTDFEKKCRDYKNFNIDNPYYYTNIIRTTRNK